MGGQKGGVSLKRCGTAEAKKGWEADKKKKYRRVWESIKIRRLNEGGRPKSYGRPTRK